MLLSVFKAVAGTDAVNSFKDTKLQTAGTWMFLTLQLHLQSTRNLSKQPIMLENHPVCWNSDKSAGNVKEDCFNRSVSVFDWSTGAFPSSFLQGFSSALYCQTLSFSKKEKNLFLFYVAFCLAWLMTPTMKCPNEKMHFKEDRLF